MCTCTHAHIHTQYNLNLKSAYSVVQEIEKGEIYPNVQIEELELVAVSNTGALHRQLFQEYWQHKHGPVKKGFQSFIIQSVIGCAICLFWWIIHLNSHCIAFISLNSIIYSSRFIGSQSNLNFEGFLVYSAKINMWVQITSFEVSSPHAQPWVKTTQWGFLARCIARHNSAVQN